MKQNSHLYSRRELLKMGLISVAGLASAKSSNAFQILTKHIPEVNTKKTKAKSIIQIWMWGGPCHIDTFDPKPNAGYDYCGPLNKAIATNVYGIQIGEKLPLLAKLADKYSIIRGMTHGINAHETASYITQTGMEPGGRIVLPCVGAMVSLFKGYDNGYKGILPPYIVLTTAQGRFSESGFLGQRYKPFCTGGNPARKVFAVEGIVAAGISDARQRQRRSLLHSLDSLGHAMSANATFEIFDKNEESAYNLMFGDAKDIFDLSKEKDSIREKYGKNEFGQSCLAARRLVENGVPYITINYRGWDTHKEHFKIMNKKLPEFDKGFAMLLSDLSDRGLLDSTIVWCTGEFGRTPKILWEAPWNGGRSHHGKAFSSVLAGGGFKGGQVVGSTDEYGMQVLSREVYPADLIASIYERVGINPKGKIPNSKGLDISILPAKKRNGILREIM